MKYPSEPCSFDSVDGSLMMMMEAEDGSPFDKQVLNSSVDIALEDKEYEQEVLKRVLSPVEGEEETAEQEGSSQNINSQNVNPQNINSRNINSQNVNS